MTSANTSQNILDLQGITKDYLLGKTKVSALRGVDLSVAAGEFTVVTGPSGSGKTTLLNIIGCLDRATSGSYKLDGEEVGNRDFDALAEVRNRKIGFIFQNFNLIPVLNVAENIEFPCVVRRNAEGKAALRQRVEALAEAVGLKPYLHHRPDELSGGQRQRVAIARALITEPKLVLADEPTANLDSSTSEQIIDLMLRLNRENGVTFLFSTHDPRVVSHARRALHIQDGKMLQGEFRGAAPHAHAQAS
ncbi:ABC transporter ATP-binding protein [Stigmatella hybrida]|uniref:ABC transporter ATP-binding protein n=1 Tax=Stigmatella hybrida TaxID=394097 RepID=UPI001CDB08B3|nr:ABC transporter ATP-binding protein [Stigmatella hybrida]